MEDGQWIQVRGQVYKREIKNEDHLIYIKNNSVLSDEKEISIPRLIVYQNTEETYKIGNVLLLEGRLKLPEEPRNPGQFDARAYYRSLKICGFLEAEKEQVLNNHVQWLPEQLQRLGEYFGEALDRISAPKDAPVLKAMLLGNKTELNPELKALYQKNGISHLLAISGLHISLIGMTLYGCLRKIGLPIFLCGVLSLALMGMYGVMTGLSVSTFRALLMFGMAVFGKMIGRTYDMRIGISVAEVVILLGNPWQLQNSGFLLSFGAVLGIAWILPTCSPLVFKTDEKAQEDGTNQKPGVFKKLWKNLSGALTAGISIQLMTLPFLLKSYFEFPTYSPLLNLLVIPLMPGVLVFGLLGILIGSIWLPMGRILLLPAHYILSLYEAVCRGIQNLPYPNLVLGEPPEGQIIGYFLLLGIFLFIGRRAVENRTGRKLLRVGAGVVLTTALAVLVYRPAHDFRFTMLDVSQGDGLFFQTRHGVSFLVDGGSSDIKHVGTYRLLPFLKSQGVGRLDYAVMTHADNDHISGLKELIQEAYPVAHLLLPDTVMKDEAYLKLAGEARQAGIPILLLEKGSEFRMDGLFISCLHPAPDFVPTDRNDYSTVLALTYGRRSFLLTGDLEEAGEQEVLPDLTRFDVLKVGHHGSRTSTGEAFLEKVSPAVALISCGEGNSYGHPHEETLERLEQAHSHIFLTQESGAVQIDTDGEDLKIQTYLQKP